MLHISLLEALKIDFNRLIETKDNILVNHCKNYDLNCGERMAFVKALHIILDKEQYIKNNPDKYTYWFRISLADVLKRMLD